MLPRRILPVLLVPAALVAACGGGEDEVVIEATPAAVQSASQATLDAETAAVEFSMTIDPAGMGLPVTTGPVELAGDGVIDFVNQRSEMRFDLSGLLAMLGGDAGEVPPGLLDSPMRTIQDGTTTYVCASILQMLAGSECVRSDLSEHLGTDASGIFGGAGIDGASLLQSLGGADDVEEIGEEDLAGVTTTHLRGTFTLTQALEQLDDADAAELQAAFDRVGLTDEFADTPQAFDVWIDTDGRVRQIRQELDLSAITGQAGSPLVTEFRYVDFGVPVDVQVPTDATDISELEELLGSFGGD